MSYRTGGTWIFPTVLIVTAAVGVFLATDARPGGLPTGVLVFLFVLGGWLVTLCLHEFAHALVAYLGGDVSVRARGYLTLNPLRYTDLAYSIVIPLILLAVGGIPLPGGAVLVQPGLLRRPWFASLVSAAGPLVNLLAGAVLAAVAGGMDSPLGAALSFLALLQFVAGILNLLPVPGFDGFGIIEPYLSPAFRERIRPIRPWLPLAVFALLWSVPQLGSALFGAGYRLLVVSGGNPLLAAYGAGAFQFWR
ncbi:site-2 protease family protein [Nakamurella flava]|uniref:Site-2 protease family protein n=1 Tax=Nakamurella flava TaxID=2576308 RepID=A0A4U6QFX0_9ACTN|nr:site-2 protease family protein [Nakamurella flava]TKV58916.1 site-2 protease family protein [Nakamurella flava]